MKHLSRRLQSYKQLVSVDGRKNLPLILLSAIILTIVAYIRSINGPLILDDSIFISSDKLSDISKHLSLYFRSITVATFALNYNLSGLDLMWFRATNIALHIATSLAVFYLTYITLNLPAMKDNIKRNSVFISLAVGSIFMLHPIQTGVVNYLTQRMALMAAMFSFIGLIFYVKAALNKNKKALVYFFLSAFFFLLAVFSKENAVMAILIIPIYDFVLISSFDWKRFKNRFLVFLILLAGIVVLAIYKLNALKVAGELISSYSNINEPIKLFPWSGKDINWTPFEYLLTELRIVSRYIFLILFPVTPFMVFDYSDAYPVSRGIFNPLTTFFSLLFLSSLIFLSIKYIKRFPLISFGIMWYFITISLESFIVVGLDPYFEHRNYLPSFGIFLSLVSLFAYIPSFKFKIRKEVVLSLIILVLFLLTFTRNGIWEKEETLWTDTASKAPDNRRALLALSSLYLKNGEFYKAESFISEITKRQLTPAIKFHTLLNLANIYKQTNRRHEANTIADSLLSDNALNNVERSNVHLLKGEILRDNGDITNAKHHLEKAYEINKKIPAILLSLGQIYILSGEIERAESILLDLLKIDTDNHIAHLLLGYIYMYKDINKSEKYFSEVFNKSTISLKNIPINFIINYAQINLIKGDKKRAIMLFEKAIDLQPAYYQPYLFLGDIHLKAGDVDKAFKYFQVALSLKDSFIKDDPNTILLYYNLAKVYIAKGEKDNAKRNLKLFILMAGLDKRLKESVIKAKEELKLLK